MNIIEQDTTYKLGSYEIRVEDVKNRKPYITVFKDNNLITAYEGWISATDISAHILKLYEELTKDCGMCSSEKTCDKHGL